ncbi:MAG: L,D-transpeptidase family protein [Aquificaceae bacterium]|nr:L,D-transpeptidase family protein [Aquificaceae bacterium]
MAVALPLLILLLTLETSGALEKRIRDSWGRLSYPQGVYNLYKLLGFKCLWLCEGKPTENLHTFQELLKEAVHHGLKPENYKPPEGVDPEIGLTDRLLKLSHHLYYGSINPSKIYDGWSLPAKPQVILTTLYQLLAENRLHELFKELAPKNKDYWFLVEQARFLYDVVPLEWKPIKLAKTIEYGHRSPCLEDIKLRLFLLGDLEDYVGSEFLDDELFRALKSFQERHGLLPTGKIDRKTLRELNVTPAERLKQIYLNLEKHRWLPRDLKRAVVINIPSFELFLVDGGSRVIHSRVIVGRNYKEDFRPTPMLHSHLESITINPKWYVPTSISVKDILPKVKRDPSYLTNKGFRVFYGEMELDPLQVQWDLYDEKNFPFRLVQEAGPKNSLGSIKFNLPNPFAIYLHDTPEKHLFKQTKRAFSSGCIRVEKAKELALYLLGEGWNMQKLEDLIKREQTKNIVLKERMPVYILYFTAFEREGKLHFREDLYGYDTILSRAMHISGGGK